MVNAVNKNIDINKSLDSKITPYMIAGGITLGILKEVIFPSLTYAQENKKNDSNKIKFDYPTIDVTTQGYNGIVQRNCIEQLTIQPDSTFIKLMRKTNRTPEENKKIRDYLMQQQNTVIIPGKVIAVDPVKHIIPGEAYALFLDSENPSKINVYQADDLIKTLEKNKDKNLADKRILGQIKNSNYNKHLPSNIKSLLENVVNDHLLDNQESIEISKMIQNYGLQGILVGIMNTHKGGTYKGKNVKGEAVPYFLYFTGNIPIRVITPPPTKEVSVPVTQKDTKKPYDNRKIMKRKPEKKNDSGLLVGIVGEYDNEFNKVMRGALLGYDFGQFSIAAVGGGDNNMNNVRFDFEPYGYATHKQGQKFVGFMIMPKIGNFEFGMGASYYFEDNETYEQLKDRNLNIDKERSKNYTKNHWKSTVGAGYNIGDFKIRADLLHSKKQPNYRISGMYRF